MKDSVMATDPHHRSGHPFIMGVATSLCPPVPQTEVRAAAERIHPSFAGHRKLAVFDNAGITTRRLAMPPHWYSAQRSPAERASLGVRHGRQRAVDAAAEALKAAGVAASDVDAVVIASTTVVGSPALDTHLVSALSLRNDVRRLPLGGMASLGGANALAAGADLVRAGYATVLVVAVEMNSMAFVPTKGSVGELVTMALFSDGAGAVVLGRAGTVSGHEACGSSGGASGQAWVVGSVSQLVPDTEHVMGFDVDDNGLRWHLSPSVPDHARALTAGHVDAAVATVGWARSDIDHYLFHPGGIKVVQACAESLGIDPRRMTLSLDVLADMGNVSGVTVLAVLERFMAQGPPVGRALLTAMGPGFGFEHVLIDVNAPS